jgi:hypothetical protein
MIDLFYPPKPHELLNRKPDFVHIIKDDVEDEIPTLVGCPVCKRTDVQFYGGTRKCKECAKSYQRELYWKKKNENRNAR